MAEVVKALRKRLSSLPFFLSLEDRPKEAPFLPSLRFQTPLFDVATRERRRAALGRKLARRTGWKGRWVAGRGREGRREGGNCVRLYGCLQPAELRTPTSAASSQLPSTLGLSQGTRIPSDSSLALGLKVTKKGKNNTRLPLVGNQLPVRGLKSIARSPETRLWGLVRPSQEARPNPSCCRWQSPRRGGGNDLPKATEVSGDRARLEGGFPPPQGLLFRARVPCHLVGPARCLYYRNGAGQPRSCRQNKAGRAGPDGSRISPRSGARPLRPVWRRRRRRRRRQVPAWRSGQAPGRVLRGRPCLTRAERTKRSESWQMLRKGWWWRGRASEQARRRKGRGGHCAPRPPAALTGPGAQFLSTRLCWVKGQLGPSRSALGWPDQAHRQTASSDNPRPAAAGVERRKLLAPKSPTSLCGSSRPLPPSVPLRARLQFPPALGK
ncbi:uncharacterized protein LOC118925529 [Manis pentadactyla]|uniref:uncharacterized protein LOC118925529 n=1 Tax=Manis pentadactyla TaxID=143292 RepID=UPI00255C419A|nr:uncharacterized protein LOC118925529 [Manis pentadactyla]